MFRQLILAALRSGPKTTKELYSLARQRQPDDCEGPVCPNRDSQGEWQHELRREQQRLKGLIELKSGYWKLKKSN